MKLPHIVGENMILQQGNNIPVWGWADPGEEVVVRFQGNEYKSLPKDGRWQVRMNGLTAGGPFPMTIAGKNKIEFSNILVGEVWICSGQSNMQWPLIASTGGEEAIKNSANPRIRLFQTPQKVMRTPVYDVDNQGWRECGPESSGEFSGVGHFFVKALEEARHVPIGMINSSFGGSAAVAWVRRPYLEADPQYRLWIEEYENAGAEYDRNKEQWEKTYQEALAKEMAEKAQGMRPRGPSALRAPQDPRDTSGAASGLYNGMIAPVLPYAIRGAIWYQGESDASRCARYPQIFQAVVDSWRQEWGRGDFPFFSVQLAGFGGNPGAGGAASQIDEQWPPLREVQADLVKRVKNTAMATAIDVGDENDIHPKNKKPVGERLALAARAVAYEENVEYMGPTFKDLAVRDGKAIVRFDHAQGGLLEGPGDPSVAEAGPESRRGDGFFEICGADGQWKPADTVIEGESVIVSREDTKEPVAVRYAWTGFSKRFLYNKEGLPAPPFRTRR